MGKVRIPAGEENFELLRKKGSYCVDKTGFIAELLDEDFKVSLITRPRRFGKTLNMIFQKKCLIRKVTAPGQGKGSVFEIE